MGLDLWFREDVARILASTHETMQSSTSATLPLDPETAAAYQRGFADALRAVGVAFGVAQPSQSPTPARPETWQQLIDVEHQSRLPSRNRDNHHSTASEVADLAESDLGPDLPPGGLALRGAALRRQY